MVRMAASYASTGCLFNQPVAVLVAAYFSLSLNMVIHLSDELGFDDTTAGFIYGLFGFAISFFGLVVGVVIDYLGVKWALTVGALISAAGRFLFAVATTKWLAVLSALIIMPVGRQWGWRGLWHRFLACVLNLCAIRHGDGYPGAGHLYQALHDTTKPRLWVLAVLYVLCMMHVPTRVGLWCLTSRGPDACMNIAALISGPATDLFRYLFGDGITLFGGHVSALRLLFLTGVVTSLMQAMISALGMREVNMNAQGEVRRKASLSSSR